MPTIAAAMPIWIALYRSNGPSIWRPVYRGSVCRLVSSLTYAATRRAPGVGLPFTSARAAPRGVNRRAPPKGIAMRKLLCRILGVSCGGIALVVLETTGIALAVFETGWLAAASHRHRARERST